MYLVVPPKAMKRSYYPLKYLTEKLHCKTFLLFFAQNENFISEIELLTYFLQKKTPFNDPLRKNFIFHKFHPIIFFHDRRLTTGSFWFFFQGKL